MQTIYLDLDIQKDEMPQLFTKQGSTGWKFRIVLTESGEPFSVPQGAWLSLWYLGTGGSRGCYSTIGDRSAFAVTENTLTVELAPEVLNSSGGGTLAVFLHREDGTQLGLWNILYHTESTMAMEGEPGQAYYSAFGESVRQAMEAVERAEQALASLGAPIAVEKGGTGATSAGQALNNLGGVPTGRTVNGKPLSADITLSAGDLGLGNVNNTADSAKPVSTAQAAAIADAKAAGTAAQSNLNSHTGNKSNPHGVTAAQVGAAPAVADSTYPSCYYRTVDGVREWINPPMIVGEKYRTSRRYRGKIVYTMIMDCGTWSAGKVITADVGASPTPIDFCGNAGLYSFPYINKQSLTDTSTTYVKVDRTGTSLRVTLQAASAHTQQCYVQIWYVF